MMQSPIFAMPAPRRRKPAVPARPAAPRRAAARVSLARALSKLGLCSRTEAMRWIAEGRVEVDGRPARDPAARVDPAGARIRVDSAPARAAARVYLMMNKPRGVLTTRADPEGRPTVYGLMKDSGLPWAGPVGRLDKASEGLLLFTNDTRWADALLDPERHLAKTYHVQVGGRPDASALACLCTGVRESGERLAALEARLLRAGEKNSWLEIVLEEGRNRQIRRMLDALGYETLRLVRVAVGPLALGGLAKGAVRALTSREKDELARAAGISRLR
jgi:23S rRNA pseudouridine2605 synthase